MEHDLFGDLEVFEHYGVNHTINELKKEIEGKVNLTLPSELKKITSTFVVGGAQTIENEEYEEAIKDVEERVACKALINQDDTEGNMYADVYVLKNVKQEAFKYDTMETTYEDGNASTYAGGDFDGACFSLVPDIVWQCFPEHLQNELRSTTPKSDGLILEQSDESDVRLGVRRAAENPPDDTDSRDPQDDDDIIMDEFCMLERFEKGNFRHHLLISTTGTKQWSKFIRKVSSPGTSPSGLSGEAEEEVKIKEEMSSNPSSSTSSTFDLQLRIVSVQSGHAESTRIRMKSRT